MCAGAAGIQEPPQVTARGSTDQDSRWPLPALGPGALGSEGSAPGPAGGRDHTPWHRTGVRTACTGHVWLPGAGWGTGVGSQMPLAPVALLTVLPLGGTAGQGRAGVSGVGEECEAAVGLEASVFSARRLEHREREGASHVFAVPAPPVSRSPPKCTALWSATCLRQCRGLSTTRRRRAPFTGGASRVHLGVPALAGRRWEITDPSAAGAFRVLAASMGVAGSECALWPERSQRGHQAKGRFEVRTEWKKEGATWRVRGPASSQG